MFAVRYPNGQAIQYNTANYLVYKNTVWELYTKEGGKWVASIQVSAGVIVEAVPACQVYDATQKIDNEKIAELTREVRSLKRKMGAKGK